MTEKPQYGLIGLGTMGAALALNIAEKGFPLAVWNRTARVTTEFHEVAGDLAERITPADTLEDFVDAIRTPRAIILMVPAGKAVDDMIARLQPLLAHDDLLIDAGNANFHDTNRRAGMVGRPYLGIGVSGGEEGARHGPSIMGGGPKEHWDRVEPMLSAIAADYEGTPCAAWMGQEGAGHFVKMVHNGIEYADMQMIAEVYGIMRDAFGMEAGDIADVFARWNEGPLRSYLIEITAKVLSTRDPETGLPMPDVILDAAGQKGTGRWTAIEAQHLAAPVPAIEAAVVARNLSSRLEERAEGQDRFGAAPQKTAPVPMEMLESALIAGKILCYAQGFTMITAAAAQFDWKLPLPEIARVWRAGCIIRSDMLNDMASALTDDPDRNLMFAPRFAELLDRDHRALREVVALAALNGIAVPALASGLAYFDAMRTARGTANLIQAQRDFFGAHSFKRLDGGSGEHGPWGRHG